MRILTAVLAIFFLAAHCSAQPALVSVRTRRVITYVEVPAPTVVVPLVATVPVVTYVQADGTAVLVERPIRTPVRTWIRNHRK